MNKSNIKEGNRVELLDSIGNKYYGKVIKELSDNETVQVKWDKEECPFGLHWSKKFLTLHEEA